MAVVDKKMVILGITGSIAAYKATELIRRFQFMGWEVAVILTNEGARFIPALTLAALSGKKVFTDMFDPHVEGWPLCHIDCARNASAIVIAPATANIIAKIACGLADDLLSCTVLATTAPVIIAPAMNTNMYNNRITQDNCKRLKELGFYFVDPIEGQLACGDVGTGHLADIESIVAVVNEIVVNKQGVVAKR